VRQPFFFYGEAEEEEEFAKKPMIPSSYAKAFSFSFLWLLLHALNFIIAYTGKCLAADVILCAAVPRVCCV
jgi:hypothetical protein